MVETTRTYVGHRYVPKIMGEWTNTIQYEGLSIVTNEGDSYTSKQMVPIGIALSNEEYWVVTGNYNAQIETYRQEVKTTSDSVTLLKNTTDTTNTKNYKYASDYVTLQEAFDSLAWNNVLILENRKVYTLDTKLVMPIQLGGIKIVGNGATLKFTNNTNCGLDLTAVNENNGDHTIENLQIEGTNIMYPPLGVDPTNQGTGLKILNNSGVHLSDVRIRQFAVGLSIENSVGCIIDGKSSLMFNTIGLKLMKMSNTHKFYGLKVRENRRKGIEISGLVPQFKPTNNIFYGCYIESNIPYNTTAENSTFGIGVEINDGYDNVFRDCYFENHKYSILLKGGSDKNVFDICRLNENTFGNDTIKITDDSTRNNKFKGCIAAINNTIYTVEFDATNTYSSTVFDGCEGFNLDNLIGKATIRNCTNLSLGKYNISTLSLPPQGVFQNVGNDDITIPGSISGIGTLQATVNVRGLGEISFGTRLTGDTTITEFTGLTPNSFLYVYNYQESFKLTIKASERFQKVVLNKNRNIVLSKYGDSVLFWVNGLGRLTEIGQNLENNYEKTGYSFMMIGTTSLIVTHNLGYTPTRLFITPRANLGSTWVSDVTDNSFKINCITAPTTANAYVDWKIER